MKTRPIAHRIVLLVSIGALVLAGGFQTVATHDGIEPNATGDLDYYVHNWNGNALANNGLVKRYDASWTYMDERSTDGSGKATWLGINTDTYNFESYYNGPGGQEYWGDDSYTLVTGSNTHHFYRFLPYSNSQWVGDTGGVGKTTFYVGETVRTKITVTNDAGSALNVKVRCVWDRNQATPFDFDQTTSLLSVSGSGGTRTYTFDYTVPSGFAGATFRLAYWVTTRLLNGNDVLSDSWVWSTMTFSVANRAPETPSTPNGPGSGQTGAPLTYSTSGIDLDGDDVKYTFDWDDGTTTDTVFGVSGWTGEATHSWSTGGTYQVTAKTVDSHGLSSGWSSPKSVVIVATGNVDYYVHNWNGNALANDGLVKRYDASWNYIDEKPTDGSGKASWTGLSIELYNFESYYNGPGGQEYWGDSSLSLNPGSNIHHFYRFLPYSTDQWVGDTSDVERTAFDAGETVRTKITITNDAVSNLDAKVRCVWDRDQSSPYDFDQTSSFQTVTGSGGVGVYTIEYLVPSGFEGASLTLAYWVTTRLLNGNDVLTDSWYWSTSIITINLPTTGDLEYYVHNYNGDPLANDGLVRRYDASGNYIDEKPTDATGKASWTGIPIGIYRFESYYNGPGGQEYWGDDSDNIGVGTNTHHFYRFLPYSTDQWMGDTSDIAKTTFNEGEIVRTKITITNDAISNLEVKVRCVWDRDQTTPYDLDQTSLFQNVVGGGGASVYTIDLTIPSGYSGSTLTLAYWVTTHLLNGNDLLTDSWVWTTFIISITAPSTGDLDYYVHNVNGDPLATDGVVKLFDASLNFIEEKVTDGIGKVSWTGLAVGTYNFESYYNGSGGQEYWGDDNYVVVSGSNVHHFYRFLPYSTDQWVGDTSDVERTAFDTGETVRTKITVRNDASDALDAKVRCVWDRDQNAPYDFDQTSSFQTVTGSGGVGVYTIEYTVPSGFEGSSLTLAYWVTTRLLNGNDVLTDSWVWTTYTIAVGGAPTSRPVLLLTFDVESDDATPSSGFASSSTIQTIGEIASLLESKNLVGTFFIQGACYDNAVSGDSFMTEVENIMLRNEIGSHSYSHIAMGSLTRSEMASELTDAEHALEMKLYSFRGPYFDISSDLQDELSAEEYIYDVSIWNGGENTPYAVDTPSGTLYEVPWRASDHDTSYAVLTQVIDNYVASGQNLTVVFHPQFIGADWTGFSNLIAAVSDYTSTSQVEVITALSAVNRARGVSLPDLSVDLNDIYFDGPTPTMPGSIVTVKYTIHNLGAQSASGFAVRLYDGDPSSGGLQIGSDVIITSLGPSLATRNSLQWTATSSGQHDIHVRIDPGNGISEAREDNNLAFGSINVMSSGPVSVSLTASKASGTSPLLVDFTASASGGSAPHQYYWEFGDGDFADWSSNNEVSKTYSQPGLFEVRVMAMDSAGQVSEWSETLQISVFKSTANPYISELIVTTDRNIRSDHIVEDINALIQFADENGVGALSLLVKEDDPPENSPIMIGQIFYHNTNSEYGDIIAPGYEGIDVLQTVLDKAHGVGIKVYAWIPVFNDDFALSKHPLWQIDPANLEAREYQLERVREVVENYDIDGIRLDYLRYPNILRAIPPGIIPAMLNVASFASDVKTLVDNMENEKLREIRLGAYVFGPTISDWFCQVYSLLEPHLDDVMPMLYWQDLALTTLWLGIPNGFNNALADLIWELSLSLNPELAYQEWLEDWSNNFPVTYMLNEFEMLGNINPSKIKPVYSMTNRLKYFDPETWDNQLHLMPENDILDYFSVSASAATDYGISSFALYFWDNLVGQGSIESRIPGFLDAAKDVMSGVLTSPASNAPDVSPFNGGWHVFVDGVALVRLGSPANVTVENSAQLKTGIDRQGNLYNEIPSSIISYFAPNKTYVIPDDCYSANIQGIGDGTYDLEIAKLQGTFVEKISFLNVPVDENTNDVVSFGCVEKEVSISTEDDPKEFDFEVLVGEDGNQSQFQATNLTIEGGETQSFDYSNADSPNSTVEMKLDEGSDGLYDFTYTMNDGTDGREIDYPRMSDDIDLTMISAAVITIIICIIVSLLILNGRRRLKPEEIEIEEQHQDEEESIDTDARIRTLTNLLAEGKISQRVFDLNMAKFQMKEHQALDAMETEETVSFTCPICNSETEADALKCGRCGAVFEE